MEWDDPWENPIINSPHYIEGMEYWTCNDCDYNTPFLWIFRRCRLHQDMSRNICKYHCTTTKEYKTKLHK